MKRWIPPTTAVAAMGAVSLLWSVVPISDIPPEEVPEVTARMSIACPKLSTDFANATLAAVSTSEVRVMPLDGVTVPQAGAQVLVNPQTEALRVQANRADPYSASVWLAEKSGTDRGLTGVSCMVPAAEQWFPGVRSNQNAVAEIILLNLNQQQAVVDFTVYSADGQLIPQGSRGIDVQPGDSKIIAFSAMLDHPDPVAIKVASSSGRVAAYVRQRFFRGTEPAGTEWITPAPPPARSAVIPGIPTQLASATLVVSNPGEKAAGVSVGLVGAEGALPLAGADEIDLPAGATRTLSLPSDFASNISALKIVSNEPVTAAVLADTTSKLKSNDVAVLVPTALMPKRSAFYVPTIGTASLSLVNTSAVDATVSIQSAGGPGSKDITSNVKVFAGASTAISVPVNQAVVVESTSDDINAALVITRKLGAINGLAVVPFSGEGSLKNEYQITYDPRVGS